MLTFAQLMANPDLLTPELRSPILHPDGRITILWEGDAGEGGLVTIVEWIEGEVPLTQIPGTDLWGVDLDAPPMPDTLCTRIPVGRAGQLMHSPRHSLLLCGSAAPQPIGPATESASLDADLRLPMGESAPMEVGGSAPQESEMRRVRVFLPPGASATDPLPIVVTLDAQFFVDRIPAFPRTTDRLAEEGLIPRVILVALDNSPTNRGGEFQAGTPENEVARRWVFERVLPWVRERYPNAGPAWLLGFSMGGGFVTQLVMGRPELFAGAAILSPAFGEAQEAVWQMVKGEGGAKRLWLSHGDFGNWEQKTLPATQELAQLLAARGHTVQFRPFPGFGHTMDAMERCFGPALIWLLG